MREIKFRGKDVETGEWRYGSLIIEGNTPYIMCGKLYFLDDNSGKFAGIYQVDPKTVGQYTEFKTKNGTEVYEYDIVKFRSEDVEGIGVIKYNPPQFKILAEFFLGGKAEILEVIGNVFDNPELIAGGKDEGD